MGAGESGRYEPNPLISSLLALLYLQVNWTNSVTRETYGDLQPRYPSRKAHILDLDVFRDEDKGPTMKTGCLQNLEPFKHGIL